MSLHSDTLIARKAEISAITRTRLANLTLSRASFFCIQARQMRSSGCGFLSISGIVFRLTNTSPFYITNRINVQPKFT